jgi:hypothetical protein
MTTVISDWQDQADAKISADYSWRRGVFESTGWHRGDRLTDLGAAAARRRSEAGVQIGARESEAALITESDVEPARPGGRIADDALRVDAEFVAAGQRGTGGSVPLLRWSSPAQVALPPVLRAARRFVPSAGRRDKERTRSAGQQVIVAASPVVQPNGMGHMRR